MVLPRNTLYGLLGLVAFGVAAIAALEIVGQTVLSDRLYVVDDVDHRLKPGSAPDLNSDGIRSPRAPAEFGADGLNVIFLGDSFVYGDRLASSESIPAQFERIARRELGRGDIRVANFGWVSSSPLLSLRLLRDIGKKYHPRLVLLAVDMTDFGDEIKYRRLLERRGVYRLLGYTPVTLLSTRKVLSLIPALHGVHERVFGFPPRRFFITDRPLTETRHHFSHIQESIDGIFEYATHDLGATFVLFVFPRTYQYSSREAPRNWEASEYELLGPYGEEPFRYFEELRQRAPYPIYSLLDDFKKTDVFPTAFDDDPHWNPEGARVAAEAVYRYCLQASCFR
jgi:hypothetical protein